MAQDTLKVITQDQNNNMSQAESFLKSIEFDNNENSVSSKSRSFDVANSSSVTISQDLDKTTLDCIQRISKINKELKEKINKGKEISTAFLDLLEEIRYQTDQLEKKNDFANKKRNKVYNYCYENMEKSFQNYK
mmetsp:Transcript_19346/g.17157  ORF Transcript_19346/g.17157 Transcript_19346/m.17157 type:complete len:134 (+) Transcript_19346:1849-2250(+)